MTSLWSKILSHKDRNMTARDTGREVARIFLDVYEEAQKDDCFSSMTRDEQYVSVVQDFEYAKSKTMFPSPSRYVEASQHLRSAMGTFLSDELARTQVSTARQYAETELNQSFRFVHVVGIIALREYESNYPDEPSVLTALRARHVSKGVYEIIPQDL